MNSVNIDDFIELLHSQQHEAFSVLGNMVATFDNLKQVYRAYADAVEKCVDTLTPEDKQAAIMNHVVAEGMNLKILGLLKVLWKLYEKHGNLPVYVLTDDERPVHGDTIERERENEFFPERILFS